MQPDPTSSAAVHQGSWKHYTLLVRPLWSSLVPEMLFWTGFLEVDKSLGTTRIDCEFSGSTAVVSLLRGATLTTAWVGDSRCVLGRKVEVRPYLSPLPTQPHRPDSFTGDEYPVAPTNAVQQRCGSLMHSFSPSQLHVAADSPGADRHASCVAPEARPTRSQLLRL